MSRIAILGLTALEAMGIRGMIAEMPDPGAAGVEFCVYSSYREMAADSDKNDIFILDASSFLTNIDFFMPRKTRSIVIIRDNSSDDSENSTHKLNSVVKTFYRNTSDIEMSETLRSLLVVPEKMVDASGDLSLREKEVLKELASGKTNKEIADILSISVNTVITHRKNISAKLGIKSVSGLSLYALMNGVI